MNKLYKNLHSYILSKGTVCGWLVLCCNNAPWKSILNCGNEHTKSFLSQFKPPVPGCWGACCTGQLVSDWSAQSCCSALAACLRRCRQHVLAETWTCAEHYVQWWVQFCLLQLDRRFKGGECWTDCCNNRWRQHLPRWKQVCRDWGNFSAEGCEEKSLHPVANLRVHSLGPNCHPRWPHLCPHTPSSSSVDYLQEERPAYTPDLHPLNTGSCQSDQRNRGMCEFETWVQLSSCIHSFESL